MSRQREEVLNVVLAECISEQGMVAAPETIVAAASRSRALPDVIVSFLGLRCVIEGKSGDVPGAREQVAADALSRVTNGIAYLAIGVVYPASLRSTDFGDVKAAMEDAELDFLVCSEAGRGDWQQGRLEAILRELRRAYGILVSDDVLARSVEHLQTGMQGLINVLGENEAATTRLADILGVYEEDDHGVDAD